MWTATTGKKVKLHQVSVTLPCKTVRCVAWLGEDASTYWSSAVQGGRDVLACLQRRELSDKGEPLFRSETSFWKATFIRACILFSFKSFLLLHHPTPLNCHPLVCPLNHACYVTSEVTSPMTPHSPAVPLSPGEVKLILWIYLSHLKEFQRVLN